ncbi:hypothetical protein JCM8547_003957 [Rhodosporidiobolus lusitaniae]
MYPDFHQGFPARVGVLLSLLVVTILVAFLYLFVTIRDTRRRGKAIWLVRLVRRPSGRYLTTNQYISYPLFSIILSSVWIAYVSYIYRMFGNKGNPRNLWWYLTLGFLPLFALLSTTTYSTTSAANLASRGKEANTHRLGPKTCAAIFAVLGPVLLGLVLGTGIWTGIKWHEFATRWEEAYDYLGEEAGRYTGTLEESAVERASRLLGARCSAIVPFQDAQFTTAIIYIVAAAILILLNLFGGIYLLSSLRQLDGHHVFVPRGTRLVAPLRPIPSNDSSIATLTDLGDATDGTGRADWEKEPSKMKLHWLRWDVVLFFASVVPSCMGLIGYEAWMSQQFIYIFSDAGLLEFACLGMIWIYAFISVVCLSALTIKTILSLRRPHLASSTPHPDVPDSPWWSRGEKETDVQQQQRAKEMWGEEEEGVGGRQFELGTEEDEPSRAVSEENTVAGESPRYEKKEAV